jgi:STE24 endopeptidase
MDEKGMHPLIDHEKQQTAKQYRKQNRVVSIISSVVVLIGLLAFLLSGISENLASFAESVTGLRIVVILIFFMVVYVTYSVIIFPFLYWSGFVIEHRFGFSRQTFRQWFFDWLKSFLVGFIFGGIVFEVIYLVTRVSVNLWWLWLALFMIVFSAVLANLFPVLILPLFYKTSPLDDSELKQRIQTMCGRAHIPIQGIFSIDLSSKSTKANAAVTGLGNTKRILLGDTLLADYSSDETISVLSHEITHFIEHHVWWLVGIQSVVTLVMFYVLYRLYPVLYGLAGFEHISELAAFPVFILIFVVLTFITKPLTSGVSRYFERRADRGALNLTEDAGSFISVMAKFCNKQLAVAYPHPLVEWYKYSHPSPGNRIRFAETWQKTRGSNLNRGARGSNLNIQHSR